MKTQDASYYEIQPETGLSQAQMDQDIEAALDWLDACQEADSHQLTVKDLK